MHSKSEVGDVFKILRLTTPKKRERFEQIGIVNLEDEQVEMYSFIRADSNSSELKLESQEDAKLADNS